MIGRPFISRQEHFPRVGSTNDVVRGWLADGTPEVCLAVADDQTAGRGREGRSWQAPPGAALLLSLGFRPSWLSPETTWRLAAVTSLAMAEAAENVARLAPATVRLKWPNDLVLGPMASRSSALDLGGREAARHGGWQFLKLAGVLGETDGLGTADPRAVVGIGVNADWAAADFPPELASTMTSLREVAGGRSVDRNELLAAFTSLLEAGVTALRDDRFDGAAWASRQATTGRTVTIETHGGQREVAAAVDVDPATGALVIQAGDGSPRSIVSAEVVHLRLAGGV